MASAKARIATAVLGGLLLTACAAAEPPWPAGGGWKRHTIDNTSDGADGVRLADANGDGRMDIVTGWEEGGSIRVYLHPGAAAARKPWPVLRVGAVASPEDAVFFDADGNGALDVLSSTEGQDRSLYIHWAPATAELAQETAWKTEAIPAARNRMRWMFALPAQVDGKRGMDFFAAGKDAGAQIGWMEAPTNSRDLAAWRWHPLRDAGWVMSLVGRDMDGDGDEDLLFSDRKGPRRGVCWLEHPGFANVSQTWQEHCLSALDTDEWMFLAASDLDGDALEDVIASVKPQHLLWFRRLDKGGRFAPGERIAFPEATGSAKAVSVGDLNGDGRADLVVTCEHAVGDKRGVFALLQTADGWKPVDVSGEPGTKFDLAVLHDVDGDGDLDVITCEEVENLGVVWYENPGQT